MSRRRRGVAAVPREVIKVLRKPPGPQKFGQGKGAAEYSFSHDIPGVSIAWGDATAASPISNGSDIQKRIDILEDITIILPMGADLTATDWVELEDGDVYKVVGKPQPWKPRYSNMKTGKIAIARRFYNI